MSEPDPFETGLFGGSPETATGHASRSTDATTAPRNRSARRASSLGRGKPSSSAPQSQPPALSGASLSMTPCPSRKGSIAPSSATKARTRRQTLSDKLTPSLISLGLVSGITPTSIRQLSGQPIRVFAFCGPDGGAAEQLSAASTSSSGLAREDALPHPERAGQ